MTPTVIARIEPETNRYSQFPAFFKTPVGPFFRGSDRYICWINHIAQSRMTKSIDGGATWTIQDPDNVPYVIRGAMRLGDIVYAAHLAPPLYELLITPFDLSTDTWGTVSSGGPSTISALYGFQWNASHTKLRCLHLDSGSFSIVLSEYDVAGDSWAAPQTIVSSAILQAVWSCISDSSGTLHFFYSQDAPAGSVSYYVQAAGDGTPTTPVEVSIHNVGYGAFLGDRYVTAGLLPTSENLGVLIVDPYTSTEPTITILDQGYPVIQPHVCTDGTKAYVFFIRWDEMQVCYVEYDGLSVSGPFIWHDQLNNPPAGTATEGPSGPLPPWNLFPPLACPDLGVTAVFALSVTPSLQYAMFYSENCAIQPTAVELITVTDAVEAFLPPPLPPGGGAAGNNNTMLLLDLSEARATLPDYD